MRKKRKYKRNWNNWEKKGNLPESEIIEEKIVKEKQEEGNEEGNNGIKIRKKGRKWEKRRRKHKEKSNSIFDTVKKRKRGWKGT